MRQEALEGSSPLCLSFRQDVSNTKQKHSICTVGKATLCSLSPFQIFAHTHTHTYTHTPQTEVYAAGLQMHFQGPQVTQPPRHIETMSAFYSNAGYEKWSWRLFARPAGLLHCSCQSLCQCSDWSLFPSRSNFPPLNSCSPSKCGSLFSVIPAGE